MHHAIIIIIMNIKQGYFVLLLQYTSSQVSKLAFHTVTKLMMHLRFNQFHLFSFGIEIVPETLRQFSLM